MSQENYAASNGIPGPLLSEVCGDLPGDLILCFVMSKVQPWVLQGDLLLVTPGSNSLLTVEALVRGVCFSMV